MHKLLCAAGCIRVLDIHRLLCTKATAVLVWYCSLHCVIRCIVFVADISTGTARPLTSLASRTQFVFLILNVLFSLLSISFSYFSFRFISCFFVFVFSLSSVSG